MISKKQATIKSCLKFISLFEVRVNFILKLTFFLILAFFTTGHTSRTTVTSREIINLMSESSKEVKTLRFRLKKKERIEGVLRSGEQEVKFNHTPKKIYTKIHAPNKGAEVLYVEGENKNKAFVNPNGFPYVTLSLDPYSSTMRNNNHHTVHEVGFDYINNIITYFSEKAKGNFEKTFIYKGDTTFNNRKCYKLLVDYQTFQYVNYTVKESETVTDIAYNNYVSDYMILQLNKDIDDYQDVKAGQVITIPNAYARKTLLYIDKENNLPIVQMMFDEKGLYAQYEFYDLQFNPPIAAEEFTKDYKDYNF